LNRVGTTAGSAFPGGGVAPIRSGFGQPPTTIRRLQSNALTGATVAWRLWFPPIAWRTEATVASVS
jgi:hypothetical protein